MSAALFDRHPPQFSTGVHNLSRDRARIFLAGLLATEGKKPEDSPDGSGIREADKA